MSKELEIYDVVDSSRYGRGQIEKQFATYDDQPNKYLVFFDVEDFGYKICFDYELEFIYTP